MFPKNEPNNLRQTKTNEIEEESYLNYTIITKYDFSFLFLFCHHINLLNIHKK